MTVCCCVPLPCHKSCLIPCTSFNVNARLRPSVFFTHISQLALSCRPSPSLASSKASVPMLIPLTSYFLPSSKYLNSCQIEGLSSPIPNHKASLRFQRPTEEHSPRTSILHSARSSGLNSRCHLSSPIQSIRFSIHSI